LCSYDQTLNLTTFFKYIGHGKGTFAIHNLSLRETSYLFLVLQVQEMDIAGKRAMHSPPHATLTTYVAILPLYTKVRGNITFFYTGQIPATEVIIFNSESLTTQS